MTARQRLSVRESLRKYSWLCYGVGFCRVMEWGETVGGSSRSGRIVTTCHSGDGWCRFASIRQSARDLENIAVLWSGVKMWADRPDGDGSWRPATSVTDGVDSCPFVCSREALKYSWFVLFMWWNSLLAQNWPEWAVMHEARSRRWLSLTKNQRPFKPALGWIADFSSVAKLFVWNVCHLYVYSLESYIKWFSRIWAKWVVRPALIYSRCESLEIRLFYLHWIADSKEIRLVYST